VRRLIPLLLLLALPAPAAADRYYDSSLLAWVDAVAQAVAGRLAESGGTAAVVTVAGGRGVTDRKAQRVFAPRLERALTHRGVQLGDGVRVEFVLSVEGAQVWAVGELRGGGLPGPAAVAVPWPVDRELEALLGASSAGTGRATWDLRRLGPAPPGTLDLGLTDLDGDGGHEILLLGVDGVRTLSFRGGDPRPQGLGGPWPLPPASWPRIVAGRIAPAPGGIWRVGTTAGHSLLVDPADGTMEPASGGMPLAQPPDRSGPTTLLAASSNPPLVVVDGRPVRDLVRWPGDSTVEIAVDAHGRLRGKRDGAELRLPAERVGDRLLLLDVDRDGAPELVRTGATAPGEPDRLEVVMLAADGSGVSVLFEAAFDGSITALAAGDLDFDGRVDVVLVEDDGDAAVLWRLERGR